MTQQVGSGNGSPTRWVPSVVDDADPTGGRHVLDKDAALTPIFTALRRGEWRPSRPPAARALRSVPVPDRSRDRYRDRSRDRSWDGPPTGPIPVVPPLHLVDPWSPGSFAAPAPAPPSALPPGGTPAWSHTDVRYPEPVADPVPGHRPEWYAAAAFDDRAGRGTYDSGFHEPGFHEPGFHEPGHPDPGFHGPEYADPEYADPGFHDPRFHEAGSGDPRFHGTGSGDPRFHGAGSSDPRFHGAAYGDPRFHGAASRDPGFHGRDHADPPFHGVAYGDPRFPAPQSSRPRPYDPITDTGRHHRRLAPAGW